MPEAVLKYVPAPGSRIIKTKRDAELAFREFQRLKAREGDSLKPESVLAAARARTSPLHKFFDWNNTVAAEKWRLNQARVLIREVYVTIEYDNRPPIRTRGIVSIMKPTGKTLEGIEDVMSDDDYQAKILEEALRDLNNWRRRYAHLQALAEIIRVADRVLKEFETPAPTRRRS